VRDGLASIKVITGRGSLSEFAAGRAAEFADLTHGHGGLLFRGFDVRDPAAFRAAATALTGGISAFPEESSPRSRLDDGVFTASDYSAEVPIQFHSEHSYAYEWPRQLVFACFQPSRTGGRTLLSDTRKVLGELPVDLVDEFRRRRILYLRQFSPRRGVSWQSAFGVETLDELAVLCAQRRIDLDITGDGLVRTRQTGPPVRRHPATGEEVWFNHAFIFNTASIEPDWLRSVMNAQPPEALISQTYFGDGGEIDEHAIGHIRDAYRAAMVEPFAWQACDVLVIDNMLLAHAREPYTGERKVVVAMAGAATAGDDH
jgi:alpha-ketoglutarate-dependent taurine dioxygenase